MPTTSPLILGEDLDSPDYLAAVRIGLYHAPAYDVAQATVYVSAVYVAYRTRRGLRFRIDANMTRTLAEILGPEGDDRLDAQTAIWEHFDWERLCDAGLLVGRDIYAGDLEKDPS